MKINCFRGNLTDIPAKKEALVLGDNSLQLSVYSRNVGWPNISCTLKLYIADCVNGLKPLALCLSCVWVPTNENWADCLTNALPKQELLKRLAGMGMCHATVNGEALSLPWILCLYQLHRYFMNTFCLLCDSVAKFGLTQLVYRLFTWSSCLETKALSKDTLSSASVFKFKWNIFWILWSRKYLFRL